MNKQKLANACWNVAFAATIIFSVFFFFATTLAVTCDGNNYDSLFHVSLIGILVVPGLFGAIASKLDD